MEKSESHALPELGHPGRVLDFPTGWVPVVPTHTHTHTHSFPRESEADREGRTVERRPLGNWGQGGQGQEGEEPWLQRASCIRCQMWGSQCDRWAEACWPYAAESVHFIRVYLKRTTGEKTLTHFCFNRKWKPISWAQITSGSLKMSGKIGSE